MNIIHSHIRSLDHFDEFWNKKIDLCSSCFRNNIVIAYLYRFNITSFLKSLSDSYVSNIQPLNSLHVQKHMEYFGFDSETFLKSYNQINNFYTSFQLRKKTVPASKLEQFVQHYESLDAQSKERTVLPYNVDELFSLFFTSLYPSVRSSVRDFLLNNNLVVFDKKLSAVYVKTFTPNIKSLQVMNKNSSQSLVSSFGSDFIESGSVDLQKMFSFVLNLVENLKNDNEYLERHINGLNERMDRQDKEGMNGYLLTWH